MNSETIGLVDKVFTLIWLTVSLILLFRILLYPVEDPNLRIVTISILLVSFLVAVTTLFRK